MCYTLIFRFLHLHNEIILPDRSFWTPKRTMMAIKTSKCTRKCRQRNLGVEVYPQMTTKLHHLKNNTEKNCEWHLRIYLLPNQCYYVNRRTFVSQEMPYKFWCRQCSTDSKRDAPHGKGEKKLAAPKKRDGKQKVKSVGRFSCNIFQDLRNVTY